MKSTSITADEFANTRLPKSVTRIAQIGQTNSSVINQIKEMYAKPAAVLADWLKVSERTAKRKLNCQRELSIEELGTLIRSERGFEIVTAVMGEAKPQWWKICVPVMEAADVRLMQVAARKRLTKVLENALEEDEQLSAAISRAENLAVQDEDHMRGHINALRSMRRVPNRTVAKRGKVK